MKQIYYINSCQYNESFQIVTLAWNTAGGFVSPYKEMEELERKIRQKREERLLLVSER